jgi:hypothetical protein
MVVAGIALLGLLLCPFAALTAIGSRRRGAGPVLTVVAALCFPITWTVWYVRDEHPYERVTP